jgi:uncharacterized protein
MLSVMVELTTSGSDVLLPVKVVPGASRTRCAGTWDGRLKVLVAAAPEKGKANIALVAFLAKHLGVQKRRLTVEKGTTSPLKVIRIAEADVEAVRRALGADGADGG